MDVRIGDTTIGSNAQAATGVFNGPVTFSNDPGVSSDKVLRACRHTVFLTDPAIDRNLIVRAKGNRTKGTCEWILRTEQYETWLKGHSRLLWIRGGPGKGKTMMSVFLSQELERTEHRTVAFYFCSGQDERRNSATSVLRGLLWQITTQHPELTSHIVSWFEPPDRAQDTLSCEETLWQLCLTIVSHMGHRRVYWLVDGLDECDEDSSDWLVSKFASLALESDCRAISLIVLSRDMSGFDVSDCITLDPDHRGQVSADVETFVRIQLQEVSQKFKFSETFQEYVVAELLSKSQGTFLWVGFVIRELSKKRTSVQVAETIRHLPKGLPAFYARMLHQIEPERRENAKRLLTWVAMALKPLSFNTIADILESRSTVIVSKEQATLDEIALCAPILQVQGPTVEFVHESAKDYLLRTARDSDPVLEEFRIASEAAHLHLAQRCLEAFRVSGYLQYYALLNWPKHAQRLGKLAPILFGQGAFFFDATSVVRDAWWRRYSMNFGGLPAEPPPRLHIAAYLGLESWVRWLISDCSTDEREGSINQCCANGWTPLDYAVEGGSEAVVNLILDHKDLPAFTKVSGEHFLHQATRAGHEKIVSILIHRGVDPRSQIRESIFQGEARSLRLLMPEDLGHTFSVEEIGSMLDTAATTTNVDAMKLLLKRGADKAAVDRAGGRLLSQAVDRGKWAIVKLLQGLTPSIREKSIMAIHQHLHEGRSQDPRSVQRIDAYGTRSARGKLRLHRAVSSERLELVDYLLSQGFEPNFLDEDGRTTLHVASGLTTAVGVLIIKLLLDYNADPNLSGLGVHKPLHTALTAERYGRFCYDTVKLLLDHGASPNAYDPEGLTPLGLAVSSLDYSVAELLLAAGADPNKWDELDDLTPLYSAVHSKDIKFVRLLLRYNANPDAGGTEKDKPLHAALNAGHLDKVINHDMVRILLEHGASLNILGQDDYTPLHWAVASLDFAVTELLLVAGASPNTMASEETTPLQLAVYGEHTPIIKLLLRFWANPSTPGADGTPLHIAMSLANLPLVKLLLDCGADASVKDHRGRLPLHIAVGQSDVELMRALFEKLWTIEDINTVDCLGRTPLHAASEASNTRTTRMLLDRGADPNIKDRYGRTALYST